MSLLAIVLSYILGSIPNGLIFGKAIWNVDLRQHGSKNIGATNAWRTIGKKAGLLIFTADLLKGAVSVWLGYRLADGDIVPLLCGIMAIAGHSWSLFLGFKGGKGVATGLGVIAMLMPTVTALVFLIWLGIVYVTGYVSLGSIVAAALVPLFAWIFDYNCWYIGFGALAAMFIIVRHKTNIDRLLKGTESKIKAAK